MPLSPASLTATLTPSLFASGMIGTAMPKLAVAVANGTALYAQQMTVSTIDTGTLGVGVSILPLLVPQPILLANILIGIAGQGIVGPMSPLLALGLATGLSLGFLTGLVTTQHPTVGVGAGVARFSGSSAVTPMVQAFSSAGMTGQGSVKQATAIGIGLDLTFAALVLPVPIVGAPAPAPSAGVGFGKII